MCDYSLQAFKSRPAKVGDKLTVSDFGISYGTRGFAAPEDKFLAVCLLPGTELSFAKEVRRICFWGPWSVKIKHKTAIFRQVNKKQTAVHHDALEFPDGQILLLTFLKKHQQATVLQLPTSAGVSHLLSVSTHTTDEVYGQAQWHSGSQGFSNIPALVVPEAIEAPRRHESKSKP